MGDIEAEIFQPPPGPPPQHRETKEAHSWELELFHPPPEPPPSHHFRTQGWRRLPLSGTPKWSAIDHLFRASKVFFDRQDTYKNTKISRNTEEGFYRVPGEKEYLTIRDFSEASCPEELRSAGRKAWKSVFSLFSQELEEIERKLSLKTGALSRYAEASDLRNGNEKLGASMLRCFRYEWNHDTATVVSEGEYKFSELHCP